MKLTLFSTALATAASLALTACGGEVEKTDTPDVAAADETAAPPTEFDPMSREYELREDAVTRRAAFDSDAFGTEYDGYRGDIMAERDTEESMAAERAIREESNGEMKGSADATDRMPMRDTSTNMRPRKNMTWSYLDRNGDNQLSVAEYAIWAIPLSPNNKAANDQGTPQLNADQANKAADSFFYYDSDGDTYLSRQEFSNARLGRTL